MDRSLTTLMMLVMTATARQAQTYQVFNYTWIIQNQAGDRVNSSSKIGAKPHWPELEVDICVLALGADAAWGTPDYYMPQLTAVNTGDKKTDPGCSSDIRRTALALHTGGIYVCPGTHRDRSLNYKCGYENDFYCASWGCETTGDTYWTPSSSWDYITVKRLHPNSKVTSPRKQPLNSYFSPNSSRQGWCNPLQIGFTTAARTADWTKREFSWGLRIYKEGTDWGLTFKIQLQKEIPNKHKASIGPNPQLHHPNSPNNPRLPGTSPPFPALGHTTTLFQPTIPAGGAPLLPLIYCGLY